MRSLTFCSNILPGTGFDEHMQQLELAMPTVKEQTPWLKTLGLRMSAEMVSDLMSDDSKRNRLVSFLAENDLLISTVNAFPMHDFHEPGLKDNVYLPDWSSTERFGYTRGCARLLAELPTTPVVSMSTVPLGYKGHHPKIDLSTFLTSLLNMVSELKEISLSSGKRIVLALEPEPECLLESKLETLQFFKELYAAEHLTSVEERKNYLGVCLDTCHFAVNFESCQEAIKDFQNSEVSIFKIQLSNAIKWKEGLSDETLAVLYDDTYLHQIRQKNSNGSLTKYSDAPSDTAKLKLGAEEWRCHFHTPIFQSEYETFSSTQDELIEAIEACQNMPLQCFEVETYTWGVLPEYMKPNTPEACIAAELNWANQRIQNLGF